MGKKAVKNWLNLSDYDYSAAKTMLDGRKYLYVAFTCQQTLEKILKAVYTDVNNDTPPYTHNLKKLADLTGLSELMDPKQSQILEKLNSYYIETRYTEELEELSKLLTQEKTEELYVQTGELLKWLKTKIR